MAEVPEPLRAALAGWYTFDRELGRGGMATVYLARDLRYGRPVAVKVLHPELTEALGRERFLREIDIAARLNHPHILPLLDSGEASGFLYYVMPHVEGESLKQRLAREKQLPLSDALAIAGQVALALHFAHEHGVVHRDVKPGNILLAGGQAIVADFGIARAVRRAAVHRDLLAGDSGAAHARPRAVDPHGASYCPGGHRGGGAAGAREGAGGPVSDGSGVRGRAGGARGAAARRGAGAVAAAAEDPAVGRRRRGGAGARMGDHGRSSGGERRGSGGARYVAVCDPAVRAGGGGRAVQRGAVVAGRAGTVDRDLGGGSVPGEGCDRAAGEPAAAAAGRVGRGGKARGGAVSAGGGAADRGFDPRLRGGVRRDGSRRAVAGHDGEARIEPGGGGARVRGAGRSVVVRGRGAGGAGRGARGDDVGAGAAGVRAGAGGDSGVGSRGGGFGVRGGDAVGSGVCAGVLVVGAGAVVDDAGATVGRLTDGRLAFGSRASWRRPRPTLLPRPAVIRCVTGTRSGRGRAGLPRVVAAHGH